MTRLLCVLFLSFIFSVSGSGQDIIKISSPELELVDNLMHISFDIESSDNDEFRVWIEATDSEGQVLNAATLSGDIGDNIKGGGSKKIIWDIVADGVDLSEGVYIQIFAERENAAAIREPEPDVEEATEIIDEQKDIKDISGGGALIRSAILPGWGMTYATGKKVHLLKGVISYGCLGASVLYNRKGIDSYNSYLDAVDIEERETLFNNSVKEDRLSEAMAYAAIGVWVVDMVWTAVGASNAKRNGLSLDARIDSMTGTTMLAFSVRF